MSSPLIETLLSLDIEKSNRLLQEIHTPTKLAKSPNKFSLSTSPFKGRSPTSNEEYSFDVARKKKKFKHGPRDSMAKRYNPGQIGSRRYNRWLNDMNLSDNESELTDDDYFDENYEPAYGCFGDLFLYEENYNIFEPFLDTTEEQQKELLDEMGFEEDMIESSSSDDDDDEPLFSNLSRLSRKVLKLHVRNSSLHHIDDELYNFQKDNSADEKTFKFDDSLRRLLVHTVSSYYNLRSHSKCNEEGIRITEVYKINHTKKKIAEKSLISILQEKYI